MMKIHPLVRRYLLPLPFLAMMAVGGAHQLEQWQAGQRGGATTMEALVARGFAVTEIGHDAATPSDAHLSTHVYMLAKDNETWRCLALVEASAKGSQTTQYQSCDLTDGRNR